MNLQFESSDSFLNGFLQPISRITDSGILKVEPEKLSALISTGDGTIIVYGEYYQKFPDVTQPVSLNIPDVKKLLKLLCLIDGPLNLSIDAKDNHNNISYSSSSVRFKYHLYEDGIIKIPSLNMAKLKTIDFDTTFTIKSDRLLNLLKGSTLSPDVSKMYLTFTDGVIHGEITDKARHNVDSYACILSDSITGTQPKNGTSIPINFEIIRLLTGSKLTEFKVKLATKLSVFNFEVATDKVSLNYIVSALIN